MGTEANRDTRSIRVGFWNTWLLRPRMWVDGPRLPGGDSLFAPDVDDRAPLVAEAVRGRFDVIALSEVFERSEQWAVQASWPRATAVAGPVRRGIGRTGSGLLTLAAPGIEVVHTARIAYRSKGDPRDSDFFSSKGALLTRIRVHPDLPELDVVSTHLLAGGDFFPLPGADDVDRHHELRMRQVDELVAFLEEERRPSNPMLLVGDMNVPAFDPTAVEPTAQYDDLAVRLERIGLVDLWATQGVGSGHSCSFTTASDLPADPDEPDRLLDDPDSGTDAPGERIDYLWLAQPLDGKVSVEAARPHRWSFPGRTPKGGPAGSLSDHLALSTVLTYR